MYQNLKPIFTAFFLFITVVLELSTCQSTEKCHATNFWDLQNPIIPNELSDMICFNRSVTFMMGTDKPIFKLDGEGPKRKITLNPFCIDLKEAELYGDSLCMEKSLSLNSKKNIIFHSSAPWWVSVKNVSWLNPEGPDSNIDKKLNHPVVHVSWNDAKKYCGYLNKRLPTEAEWEFSCRGDLDDRLYPWGNNDFPKETHLMNIWQGEFPNLNTIDDGFEYTAPVDEFDQNKFHMKNIVGNVWEWTDDWWTTNHESKDKHSNIRQLKEKTKKGGSFMCHKNFCHRYRCAARSKNTPQTTAMNIGFRCAESISL